MINKRKLAIYHFLRVWMILTFILLYFLVIATLWIMFHPIIAAIVWFLTFGIACLYAEWFYSKLGENLG
jgi:hypothetical protein